MADAVAFTLLAAPAAFIGLALLFQLYEAAYESLGFIYMGEIVAAALLLERLAQTAKLFSRGAASRRWHAAGGVAVLGGLVVIAAVHIPKARFSLDRYVTNTPETVIFRQTSFEKMAGAIGERKFTIDTLGFNIYLAQSVLAYFGALGYDVRFTRDSWLFGNRGFPYPEGSDNSNFRITLADAPIPAG